jgi:hypothetical protein
MKSHAVIKFDNDDMCLEMGVVQSGYTKDFQAALKKVASAVIHKEVPEVSTGIRAFGEVLLDPSSGITFWGWKVGEKNSEELTGDDGRAVDPATLAEVSADEEIEP